LNSTFLIRNIVAIAFLTLASCGSDNNTDELHYRVVPTSFSDHIIIEGQVNAINTSMVVCPQNIHGTVVYIVEDGTAVEKGDTVCMIENRELENNYDQMLTRLENSKARYEKGLADLEMNYALLEAQIESNEAQTSIANLDSAQLKYLTEQQRRIKELEIEKAAIEKEKLQKKKYYLEIINESKLRKLKIEIEQDELRVEEYKERLSQMVLTAPRAGIARPAKFRRHDDPVKEGDDVWRGHPLVEIPDISEVNVLVEATETQFKRITIGDTVEYTFDAMAGNRAWGVVAKKAPIGRSVNRDSNVKVFDITASVDSFLTIPEVGISANCKITFNYMADTMVVPQVAVYPYDSIYVAYVKDNRQYKRCEIKKGYESPKETVIVNGLKYNDMVSLVEPAEGKVSETIYLDSTETNNTN
jgi:HlyD family secretion protein/macrolide-specific efflux system membrane fusion protein